MSDIQAGLGSEFGKDAASGWRLAGFAVGGRSALGIGTEQEARQRGVPAPVTAPVVAAPPRPADAASPDAADPAAGSRLGAARGILIGLALSALAWAGLAALAVLALR